MASHIEKSAKRQGRSTKTAERIAWATVNKQTGGAKGKKSSRSKAGARRKHASSKRTTSRKRS